MPIYGDVPAVAPFPYDETIPSWLGLSGSSVGTANSLIAVEAPNRPDALLVANLSIYVVATGGNLRLMVLTYDGTTWTIRGATASTAVGANGVLQTAALATPYTVPGGVRRFYGVVADGTTATFGRPAASFAVVTEPVRRVITKASMFAASVGDTFVAASLGATPTITPFIRASAT